MGHRVLIIDDDRTSRGELAGALRACAVHVVEAAGIAQATELASDPALDLAVVDLMMPGVAGIQLVRHLQAGRPNLPVLLMSQYHLQPRQVRRIRGNVAGMVLKPVAASTVLQALAGVREAAVSPHSS